jgi:uncharacterized alpha-E superfamily protein
MLSRVANSLFWLSRYIERAENLARLVDVNLYNSLEAYRGPDEERVDAWRAVLYSTSSEAEFDAYQVSGGTLDVGGFMALDDNCPDSIRRCVASARENARMVRDQITQDMWLELNSIHLFLQSRNAETLWKNDPNALLRRVVDFSMLFQGLCDTTSLHNEGWLFVQAGRYIERADKTSRILDMLTFTPDPPRAQMSAVLHCCSAFAAFREEFRGVVTLENVAQFLLFSEAFPRSARFCVRQLDETLHSISGAPRGGFCNEPERLAGSLLAQLNFSGIGEVQHRGIHAYIDDLQQRLNRMGQAIFEQYVLLPFEIDQIARAGNVSFLHQRQQQQQQ